MRVGFRIATDPRFGGGHLARCKALAQALSGEVTLFCDPSDERAFAWASCAVAEISTESASHAIAALSRGRIDVLLIDSHAIEERLVEQAAALGFVAVFRDGLPYGAEHVTIDPNPGSVASGSVLKGPSFMPLPPAFAEGNIAARKDPNSTQRADILVAFGARDSTNRTMTALQALSDLKDGSPVRIALGQGAMYRDAIAARVSRMPGARIAEVDEMLTLYKTAAVAIGAPGVSQFERACYGIPTVLSAQNARQERLCREWERTGAAIACEPESAAIHETVRRLLADRDRLRCMREQSLSTVDGEGATRLARALTERAAV